MQLWPLCIWLTVPGKCADFLFVEYFSCMSYKLNHVHFSQFIHLVAVCKNNIVFVVKILNVCFNLLLGMFLEEWFQACTSEFLMDQRLVTSSSFERQCTWASEMKLASKSHFVPVQCDQVNFPYYPTRKHLAFSHTAVRVQISTFLSLKLKRL